MNGKPRDHPLTDIVVHGLPVYGREADELIRRIAELSGMDRLYDWWDREIGWGAEDDLALRKARERYARLSREARERSWEID